MSKREDLEDKTVRELLPALAGLIDEKLPEKWGFILLAFPFGLGGRTNYVANADRADVVRSMYEFIEVTKGKWGEHVRVGAAEEDTELARLRQKTANLEHLLEKKTIYKGPVGS